MATNEIAFTIFKIGLPIEIEKLKYTMGKGIYKQVWEGEHLSWDEAGHWAV